MKTRQIVFASLVGTAIEFYDFYVYGTAAALVIGPVFFPAGDAGVQALNAFLTFGIAFLARPIGAFLFGHYGDRIGRKATLVASLLVMGVSTTLIGLLPGYAALGSAAPILLCLLRFGQGVGLGGEWGGAALVATENAPPGRRAWFGSFPQYGAPIGFVLANGLFLMLAWQLSPAEFLRFGWRIPFLFSAVLIVVGLVIRMRLDETAAFARLSPDQIARQPILEVLRRHAGPVLLGACATVMCFALFYIYTLFAISYLTGPRHLPRAHVLLMLCIAVIGMAIGTPVSAWLADRHGRRPVLMAAAILTALCGLALPTILALTNPVTLTASLLAVLTVMGLTYGPMGALLPELFPTRIRYTATSAAFNLGGVIGGSLTPYIAQRLLAAGGLPMVGWYVVAAAAVSFVSLLLMRETGQDRTI